LISSPETRKKLVRGAHRIEAKDTDCPSKEALLESPDRLDDNAPPLLIDAIYDDHGVRNKRGKRITEKGIELSLSACATQTRKIAKSVSMGRSILLVLPEMNTQRLLPL
jgi:hypothetical protein